MIHQRSIGPLEQASGSRLESDYLPQWTERFTVSPANEFNAHRPLGQRHDLASILSHVEERVIGQDYTIRHECQLFQIQREHIRAGLKGKRIRMERRLDGTVAAKGPDGALEIVLCEGGERPGGAAKPRLRVTRKASSSGRGTSWMNGFHLHGGPSLEEVVERAYGEPSDEFQEGTS